MNSDLIEIVSAPDLEQHFSKKAVLLFCADWHEATPILKTVLGTLAKQQQQQQQQSEDVLFATVDAENVSDLADKFDVSMVPTLVLLNGGSRTHPVVLEKIEGVVEPSLVTVSVQRLIQAPEWKSSSVTSSDTKATVSSPSVPQDAHKALNERLNRLIHGDTVMLFMKGTPTAPRCGFSRQVVELLNDHQVQFGSFDILSDEDVRQGLKTYSDWPTYPQIVRPLCNGISVETVCNVKSHLFRLPLGLCNSTLEENWWEDWIFLKIPPRKAR
jgi:glutaredoxin-related protein